MYQTDSPSLEHIEDELGALSTGVDEDMFQMLLSPYSTEEVTRALFQIALLKSPMDGAPSIFFQHHWHILKDEEDVEAILTVPLGKKDHLDAIRDDASTSTPSTTGNWDFVWKAGVPHKVWTFSWRLALSALPTVTNIVRRGVNVAPHCSICDNQVETIDHVFLHCHFAQQVFDVCWRFAGSLCPDGQTLRSSAQFPNPFHQ
ncbi:hypothetical protein Salat_2552700 [Sesamum alatum]|uniref:Reverse transcriptase zinc-binding domain-containing protein n=1 Tax=Sesamum alatum TaxID=300844 RepID=A0AAE1XTF3_9LAMI|nr:hypothetical protein Salat_2552700 [Sesamum alatum]